VSESDTSVERREIHFSGRVQGVGFRYTARAIASRHAVTGFVQNLADGRVLLVAEGIHAELDRLVAAVHAEMARHITAVDSNRQTATGEFANFEIRR
jgi:acylphosphatase